MGKYKFRFQSILGIKELMEKKIQEEISILNQEIELLNNHLQSIIEEKLLVNSKMNEGTAKVADYQSMKMYDSHLEQQIALTNKDIECCMKQKEERQKELVEKKKEIKAFETLKDNDYQNYLVEERRSELKELNEVAIRNYSGDQS